MKYLFAHVDNWNKPLKGILKKPRIKITFFKKELCLEEKFKKGSYNKKQILQLFILCLSLTKILLLIF